MTAEEIIQALLLSKHPEADFYKESYRGESLITLDTGKVKNTGTAVYYLLHALVRASRTTFFP